MHTPPLQGMRLVLGVQPVADVAGQQSWQALAGLRCPEPMHLPPIKHLSLSTVHELGSLAGSQAAQPDGCLAPLARHLPSITQNPGRGVQALVLLDGSQTPQAPLFFVPEA